MYLIVGGSCSYMNDTDIYLQKFQVAVIAGNMELAEVIRNYSNQDIGKFLCKIYYKYL